MRGPKPDPVEIRRRKGNTARKPMPPDVRMGGNPDKPPAPPKHLPKHAKQFWKEAIPTLHRVGLLDTVDTAALEMLSIQYARAREAGEVVKKEGAISTGSTGQLVEHPALVAERNAAALFLRFAEHYALTPVARTRLGLAELQRRSMAQEIDDSLGAPELVAVEVKK